MALDPATKRDALRDMAAAAKPFGFRVEKTPHSLLPDLVLLRPSDGLAVARLRYFDDHPGGPAIRSMFLHEVSREEQAEIEAHMTRELLPAVTRRFSYSLWASLAD